ncbi:MAG: UDP-N-acetylglucosamine/UDP-N-acetylgalactosamine 4-epimerase, partial [Verrucomicrobiota bacterium]
ETPTLPKHEELALDPLSPYAVSKLATETYAKVFHGIYGMETVALRYFNVFGPRQDPNGAYAAVIPRWIQALLENKPVEIFGDGETTRDFCHVENVVQANLLAATTPLETSSGVFNIACGERSSLNALFRLIQDSLMPVDSNLAKRKPEHHACRPGDVRHSRADITRAREMLGYSPTHEVTRGLEEARDWYVRDLRRRQAE